MTKVGIVRMGQAMHAVMLVGLFLTGAVLMQTTADAGQEKKVEPKTNDMPPAKPYKEWVTLKPWNENGNKFLLPIVNVSAVWVKDSNGDDFKDKDGRRLICLASAQGGHSAQAKSEITDRNGNTFVIFKRAGANGNGGINVVVEPKPEK
ncbi:MAG: hypothetical protein K8U57_31350 [Planctomycetes bacterium]|nr:hypothetical protein [Planctomycetota bacterium]